MYRAFYGLREKPFNLTPDPRFLYLSDKHKEAFAHLLYGIRSRSGFVMVTGEIGTGKTTICRNLLNQLDEDTELAFIFNPMLSPLELLKKIASEFGVESAGANALELTEELNQYLLEAAAKGKNCVLLIDEAQNLDPQVLEQIRLLSNLETETEKLLQIVLVGQPELGEKLELHELRQLNQRITARYHLKPLSEKEVLQYIAYRLHVAGGRRKVKFARAAVRAIYRISGGTPRVINALCDRALLIGFTKEVHTLTKAIVHRAHREIRGDDVFSKNRPIRSIAQRFFNPITGIAAALLVVIVFANSPVLRQRVQGYFDNLAARLPEVSPPPVVKPKPAESPESTAPAVAPTAEASIEPPSSETKVAPEEHLQNVLTVPLSDSKEEKAFPESLFYSSEAEATKSVLSTMLSMWSKTPDGDIPTSLSPTTLEDFAQRCKLAIEFLNPAIDQLEALDLPAVVQLRQNNNIRPALLIGAKDDTLTLTSGNSTWTMDRSAFRKHYTGNAIILWDDPTPNAPTLMPGSRSGEVRKLRRTLAKLGRIPADDGGSTYDGVVSKAVARIQSETSLDVDGIAGKQVRMVLQSWTKAADVPYLGTQPDLTVMADTPPSASKAPRESTKLSEASPEVVAKTTEINMTETQQKSVPEAVVLTEVPETTSQDESDAGSTPSPPVKLTNIGTRPDGAEAGNTKGSQEGPDAPQDAEVAPSPSTSPGAQLTVVELPDPGSLAG